MASSATAQAEPRWLIERRRKGASLAKELDLPDPKAKGWEFTDLSELDLDAYSPEPGSVEPSGDGARPEGVMSLDAAVTSKPDLLRDHLGSVVPAEDRGAGDRQMRIMNWIEGATKDTDAARLTHESDRRPV